MGQITRNTVDQDWTPDQDSPGAPGLLTVAVAVLSFAVCVATFALGHAGAGVAAGIVALLAFAAGLAWLSMDRRRFRQAERDWVIQHHPAR
jgi:Na+-driven multidrug efflux pump